MCFFGSNIVVIGIKPLTRPIDLRSEREARDSSYESDAAEAMTKS
jgi:hypothetical protein